MNKVIESPCGNTTILAGDDVPDIFHVTESAVNRIKEILKDEDEGTFLRIGVAGGGCSGFQNMFALDTEKLDDDHVFGDVIIDDMSIQMLKDSTLNYIKEVSGEYFDIENPHASSSCGCGSSFNLDSDYMDEFID